VWLARVGCDLSDSKLTARERALIDRFGPGSPPQAGTLHFSEYDPFEDLPDDPVDRDDLARARLHFWTLRREPQLNDPALRVAIDDAIEGRPPWFPPPASYPPERGLRQELEDVAAKINAREAAEKAADEAKVTEEAITKAARVAAENAEKANFKSAANEKGELQHPYFDLVEPAMIALAQSYVASGQSAPSHSELYETAVWANPSTRALLLASQRQAERAKATEKVNKPSRYRANDEVIAQALKEREITDDKLGQMKYAQVCKAIKNHPDLKSKSKDTLRNGVTRHYRYRGIKPPE